MYPLRIKHDRSLLFSKLWNTYEASFPASERRSLREQIKILAHPRYRLDAWMNGQGERASRFVGLMGWWEYRDFRYVEHLAVSPESRSGGVGGSLLQSWMRADPKPVFLEIDLVTDDISRRRLGFYQRLGFVENPMKHGQPDFQGGKEWVPLHLLSYPDHIAPEQYAALNTVLHQDIWPHDRDEGAV